MTREPTWQESTGPRGVRGREEELRSVDAVLEGARHGGGGVLVVAAAPGLGRSALLDAGAAAFDAGPAVCVRGTPGGSRVPGGGVRALHRALAAVTGEGGAGITPPAPRGPGGAGDAEALEGALRAAAGPAPLLVCVDDAHLWDGPSRRALAGAVRRAWRPGPVGVLLSVVHRHPGAADFAGLPSVVLAPLPYGVAAGLVDERTGGRVDPPVREELVAEAAGNPALLTFLLERLSAAQLEGRAPLPRPLADAAALARAVSPHPSDLPPAVADVLLLVAAAGEPGGAADAALVLRAGRRLGLPAAAFAHAEAAGLLGWDGGRARCSTDLLRRAVYAGADPARRRAAHGALAAALVPDRSTAGARAPDRSAPASRSLVGDLPEQRAPDPRALARLAHTALSVRGPAPGVAAALAAEASRDDPRRSHRERAAALRGAAELTAADGPRAERLAAAAEQARLAGAVRQARELLAGAEAAGATDAVRGRVELVRGVLALDDGPVVDAHEALRGAAALLAPYDPRHARVARLAAADAAWVAGDVAACTAELVAVAGGERAGVRGGRAAPPVAGDPLEEYVAGLRAALDGRFAVARAPLRRTVDRADADEAPEPLLRAGAAALLMGDVGAATRVAARALAAARAAGAAALVPRALEYLAYAELRAGQHARARAHAEEGLRAARRAGQRNIAAHLHAVLALALSVEGDGAGVAGHAAAALDTARRHGLTQAATLARWAAARADLSRGRLPEAAARLGPVVRSGAGGGHFAVRILAVPCFAEAAALSGRPEDARVAVEEFAVWASLGADPLAPAQSARCRALLAPDEADLWYERSLDAYEGAGGEFDRARTLLLYGKWLRRRRRPGPAQERLREALVAFEHCGARGWAEQAAGELRAAGSATRDAEAGALSRLTAQQARIARLVAEGATNREVAVRLSLSPRTVDHHLRNVFALLNVRSRVDLARLVDRAEPAPAHPSGPAP
ncbi:LuxR family transcriptional regulator [Streptomyces sp. DH12]|uniref:helix-turn-helix transcriptional regulator n=1 Tax=Streptomyces sp. DH12 TaxID=2857010 RepID=UPI001E54C83A|nr:LuxR family transcriptional regulator [Streptomyces sp. DH12]